MLDGCVVCVWPSTRFAAQLTRLGQQIYVMPWLGKQRSSAIVLLVLSARTVQGALHVNNRCIDCDVCRWMAPSTYSRNAGLGKSIVYALPADDVEKLRAYAAMVACPVGAIKLDHPDALVKQVDTVLPLVPGRVWHLAEHSPSSYGATPYLIRPDEERGGGIMVDTPRFSERMARRIEATVGTLTHIILTHRDDVADHNKWAKRFPLAQRVMHKDDLVTGDTDGTVEVVLQGQEDYPLLKTVKIIPVPGHTRGSIAVHLSLEAGAGILFSGDHLAGDEQPEGQRRLTGFYDYNWYSVDEQRNSIKKLARVPFDLLLPGHGRSVSFSSEEQRLEMLLEAAAGGS